MKFSRCLCVFLLLTLVPTAEADEIIAGWDRNHGQLLLGELNCTACHPAGAAAERVSAKQSPFLGTVGTRVTPQYLRAFLDNPQQVKPGTPMPDLLHGIPQNQRTATVEALVHYLATLGGPIDQRSSGASPAQIARGGELYHTVGCVACHPTFAPPPKHKRDPALVDDDEPKVKRPDSPSVPLGTLASKTTVEQLAAFLADPLHARPSGRMPSLNLSLGEARQIAAYLLRDQYTEGDKALGAGLDIAYYEGNFPRVPDFDKLKPRAEGEARGFDLAAAVKKLGKTPKSNFAVRFRGMLDVPADGMYRFWTKSDDGSVLRINGRVVVDNDGIHPPQEKEGEVTLKKGRHEIELGFTQGGGGYELTVLWQPPSAKQRGPIPDGLLQHGTAAMIPKGITAFQPEAKLAQRGKELFASLGCASCHAVEKNQLGKPTSLDLAKLEPTRAEGCLGEKPAAGRPRFAFSAVQRDALRKAVADLKQPVAAWTAAMRMDHTMAAMNCYACHSRQGKGGPDKQRAEYFAYEIVVDLGDEGRLPPMLNEVGAKLTPTGFEDALFSGQRYRSTMATRMPNFGRDNVGHLPALFAQADAGKVADHKPIFETKMVADGQRLVGKNSLACINCHAWGPNRLSGAEGLDLLQVTRRIQPGWFHAWLLNPQKFRTGTRMPTAWPDGKSVIAGIQNGDARRQIDAIWAYLAAGPKGGLPAGLTPGDDAMLVPVEEPIVFRTFLDGFGAHAILVGFPQRTHVAFDANRLRTLVVWSGDFISTKAAWEGRAGQYAKVTDVGQVRFPDGPAFAQLASPSAPWPPERPKNKLGADRMPEGWRYRGYRFNEKREPTFLYAMPDVEIEETPGTEIRAEGTYLVRRFHLTADKEVANLYLRLATGAKIVEKDGTFTVDDRVRFRVPGLKPLLRSTTSGQELLVPVPFKTRVARFEVEMTW